ncbi:GNAT family N-acetyltransferase [Leptolyngbya sp. 15MV]|nr:GNAT family N-acetyltransferase [Leptolyngbya sp. 15MV]
MDRQPVLQGDRLHLRPLAESDRAALYAVASDPQVWGQHPIHDRWREDVFGAFFDEAMASGGALAIIERATGAIVGSSRFVFQTALVGDPLEIGWTFLATRLWGTGANTELKRLMLGHALAGVERVVFRVGENNLRSRRALEKIGARLTHEVEHGEYRGQPVVHVVYQIGRAGFASGPLSAR